MKKIMLTLSVTFLLAGCTSSNSNDIVLEDGHGSAALVNGQGELVSDFKYTDIYDLNQTYLGISSDNIELLDGDGEVLQEFDLGTVTISGELFAITYENDDETSESFIYDNEGALLYDSTGGDQLLIDDVFVVVEANQSTILDQTGAVFYQIDDQVINVSLDQDTLLVASTGDVEMLSYSQSPTENNVHQVELLGNYEIIGYDTNVGYVLYDQSNRRLAVVDNEYQVVCSLLSSFDTAYFDYNDNLILVESTDNYIVDLEDATVMELNSFYLDSSTYVLKDEVNVYGPHDFFENDEAVQVSDIQLAPNGTLTINGLVPVYLRDYGFTYFNYAGVQAIEEFYDEVNVFTQDNVAIVKKGDRYCLIDETGNLLVEDKEAISIIDRGYYAIYDDNTSYYVADATGTRLIDEDFMGSGEIYRYEGIAYGVFVKAGMSYVYNLDEMTELFHYEGDLRFDNGYFFQSIEAIFDLEGTQIYQRGE